MAEIDGVTRGEESRDESAPIRAELVERVRAEIRAETYLTRQRIDTAINRLRAHLRADCGAVKRG